MDARKKLVLLKKPITEQSNKLKSLYPHRKQN